MGATMIFPTSDTYTFDFRSYLKGTNHRNRDFELPQLSWVSVSGNSWGSCYWLENHHAYSLMDEMRAIEKKKQVSRQTQAEKENVSYMWEYC